MKQSDKDPQFEELMSKSRLNMPFSNFEDEVIFQIKKLEDHKKLLKRDLQLSWVSFVSGIILGIILTIQLLQIKVETFEIDNKNIELIAYLVFSVFVIFSLDPLIRLSKKIRLKDLFSFNN